MKSWEAERPRSPIQPITPKPVTPTSAPPERSHDASDSHGGADMTVKPPSYKMPLAFLDKDAAEMLDSDEDLDQTPLNALGPVVDAPLVIPLPAYVSSMIETKALQHQPIKKAKYTSWLLPPLPIKETPVTKPKELIPRETSEIARLRGLVTKTWTTYLEGLDAEHIASLENALHKHYFTPPVVNLASALNDYKTRARTMMTGMRKIEGCIQSYMNDETSAIELVTMEFLSARDREERDRVLQESIDRSILVASRGEQIGVSAQEFLHGQAEEHRDFTYGDSNRNSEDPSPAVDSVEETDQPAPYVASVPPPSDAQPQAASPVDNKVTPTADPVTASGPPAAPIDTQADAQTKETTIVSKTTYDVIMLENIAPKEGPKARKEAIVAALSPVKTSNLAAPDEIEITSAEVAASILRHKLNCQVWSGSLNIQSKEITSRGYLLTSARTSGLCSSNVFSELLPSLIWCQGRLKPSVGTPYVKKQSARKFVVYMQFECSGPSEEWDSLLESYHAEDRWFVVGATFCGVRDMYLAPLKPGQRSFEGIEAQSLGTDTWRLMGILVCEHEMIDALKGIKF